MASRRHCSVFLIEMLVCCKSFVHGPNPNPFYFIFFK